VLAQNSAAFSLVPMILLFVAIFPTPFPVHPLNVRRYVYPIGHNRARRHRMDVPFLRRSLKI